jgi:hypothetical protein
MNWKDHATLGVSVKLRNDYADYDYLDKLSPNELKWLKGFHREYINADFAHRHTRHYKSKKQRKAIYDANNARNRDLYGIYKWTGELYTCASLNNYEAKLKHSDISILDLLDKIDEAKNIVKRIDKNKKVV